MSQGDDRELLRGTWWFPARKLLPGWGFPVCWQGWAVVAVYFALLLGPAPLVGKQHTAYYLAYMAALTAALFGVVWKKGEPLG